MLDVVTTVIEMINTYQSDEAKVRSVQRMVLNEAYYNLDLCALLQTAAVKRNPADRARLIGRFRVDSRKVMEVANVDDQAVFASRSGGHFLTNLFNTKREQAVTSFKDWTAYECYHFALNKIEIMQTIVAEDLTCAESFKWGVRLTNVAEALRALVEGLRRC